MCCSLRGGPASLRDAHRYYQKLQLVYNKNKTKDQSKYLCSGTLEQVASVRVLLALTPYDFLTLVLFSF